MDKVLKSTSKKLWCLSACKKSTSSLTPFTRYCKDIANFLFWEFGECLSIPIKNHFINLKETFMLICMQKINFSLPPSWDISKNDSINLKKPLLFIYRQKIDFILHVFLDILQGYCKLVILGNLGMVGYAHPKWYYQFVENFGIYLQAKN